MNLAVPHRSLIRVSALVAAACGWLAGAATPAFAQPKAAGSPLPDSVALKAIPADAVEVAAAVPGAKAGDKLTLRGRIAMARDAFDPAKASFVLTDDASASSCCPKDGTLVETCKLDGTRRATVRIVDAAGQPLSGGLEGRAGLKHGAEVFVVGTVAASSEKDALVVNATGVHVPTVGIPLGLIGAGIKDAKDVSDLKKAGGLKKGDRVVLRGLVGGSKSPFVSGRTMFTLVGNALHPCNASGDDHCKTPWDYCCDPKSVITANSATVRIVDGQGNPLKADLKGRAGIRELSEIVVSGKVLSADKGTLIVDAEMLEVAKP